MQDIFVAKYNSSGTRQWTRMLGSTVFDYCYGVAVDGSENVYAAGHSYGDFDGLANTDGSGTTEDIFLAKFNSSGTKQWSRLPRRRAATMSHPGWPSTQAGMPTSRETPTPPWTVRRTLAATTSSWSSTTRQGPGSGPGCWGPRRASTGAVVAVDGSGNAYLTGLTGGNLDGATNAGGNDGYLVKYDTSGTLQ